MTRDELTAKFAAADAVLPGKRIRLDLGDDGQVMLDGVAGRVSNDVAPADLVISVALADLAALKEGSLNPMTAYFTGRIGLDGDMMLAMRIRELLDKVDRHV